MDNPKDKGDGQPGDGSKGKPGKKVRVAFKQNRAKPRRVNDWTDQAKENEDYELDSVSSESVVAKGDLSRRRTIIVPDGDEAPDADLRSGVVVAMRGLIAEVDDGERVWPCTVRRVLRTRLIEGRHPVTIGDRVRFRIESEGGGALAEGVIERVEPRTGRLTRMVRGRVHTIAANIDRAIIVSSAALPDPKPHLIDRYIVASLAGGIAPLVCMNKIDLDVNGRGVAILERFAALGYRVIATSAVTGAGIESFRGWLAEGASVLAGQSGVGKSSLLNALQPGLALKVGDIVEQTQKGRHTTTTATLIRLESGGYVVDTPGVKSLDVSTVPLNEIEMHFVEFGPHIPRCKFADCTHTHEIRCAVLSAVDSGAIHPERYESYVRLFQELSDVANEANP
jgi:ribosome biogenesis GTPase